VTGPGARTPGFARRLSGEPWLFWLLTVHMLGQGGTYLVKPMVSYRALDLGIDAAGLGLLSASFSLAPLVVALWLGRQVDRRGELLFVVAGNGLMMASAFGLALVGGIVPMFLFFAGLGLGHLGAVVAAQGMVARGSDEASYDRRFSAFSFAGSIGQFMGPAIAGAVAGQGSRDEVTRAILVGAVVLLATLPFAALIRPPTAEGHVRRRHGQPGPGTSIGDLLRTPGVVRAILVSTTVLSAIDIVIVYLPALGEERGWSASLVGILLAIRAAASMLMRLVLGTAAARYGRGRLLIVSMAISAVALMALSVDAPIAVVALLMIFSGAGLGIGQPLTMSWVASLSSPGARATALSLRLMGNRVGQVALPVVVGSVAAVTGSGGVLGVTGAIVAMSLVGAYGGLDRRSPAARRAQEAAEAARAAAIAAGSNAAPSSARASTAPSPSSPSAASAAPASASSSAPEGSG
jgi:MFS family permease